MPNEWEKAARGNNNWKFPWGDKPSFDKANCATDADGYKLTAPVDSFPGGASLYGVLNMAGNVWEWCFDSYNSTYYYVSPPRNPKGPKNEERHVLRGGSWDNSRYDARITRRWSYWPDLQRNYIGLRLVFPSE
jgi:formylglycine-generating enzyme required for sulfatase activity